jgi:hypothetical protein
VAEARLFQEVRAGKSKRGPEEQVVSGEEESQFGFVERIPGCELDQQEELKTTVEGQFAWCCLQSFFFFFFCNQASAAATFLQTAAMSELNRELYIMSMSSIVATNDAPLLEAVGEGMESRNSGLGR